MEMSTLTLILTLTLTLTHKQAYLTRLRDTGDALVAGLATSDFRQNASQEASLSLPTWRLASFQFWINRNDRNPHLVMICCRVILLALSTNSGYEKNHKVCTQVSKTILKNDMFELRLLNEK